jgi:hypothetical protein
MFCPYAVFFKPTPLSDGLVLFNVQVILHISS